MKGTSEDDVIRLKVPGLVLLIVLFFFIYIFLGVNILNKRHHCLL